MKTFNCSLSCILFRDFDDSSCESISWVDSDEEIEYNGIIESDLEIALKKLLSHFIKYKITYECLENTAKLMNSMPGATVQLPTTKYSLLKAFQLFTSLRHRYHIYCGKCKLYDEYLPNDGKNKSTWSCANCDGELKLCDKKYFVAIKLEEQLKQILNKHWEEIEAYKIVVQSDDCKSIKDTYSGMHIRQSLNKKTNILSLMINTDGISLKKSGVKSVWPLQIICNFLPPQIRYRKENILCVAFFCDDHKPDMLKFLEPFANDVETLQSDGFVFNQQFFSVAVTCAVLDLPAKATFQQLTQYNGYHACGYCFHAGEKLEKGIRYTCSAENIAARTNDGFLRAMDKISKGESELEDGVRGISPAVSFNNFDMVKSFGLDYLHNVCLGVMKTLLEFWLNPSKKQASYIKPDKQLILNNRIRYIKPCRYISRLPRSLQYRKLFKASEYRSFLLYYLPVVLGGLLEHKYLKHFRLLAGSIFKLLSTKISNEDLVDSENDLILFVKQYQEYYGKENMTMNVHLISHIVCCVKNLGPLWSQSMFSFESNNATISRYVKGCNDTLAEISTRYMLHKSLKKESHPIHGTSNKLSFAKKIKLSVAFTVENIPVDISTPFQIYCAYKRNNERFTSEHYSIAKKTIDYVVELKNDIVGKIKFFFEFESRVYIRLEQYERVGQILHLYEIKSKEIESVHPVEHILKKFIYVHFLHNHYITNRPNAYESD